MELRLWKNQRQMHDKRRWSPLEKLFYTYSQRKYTNKAFDEVGDTLKPTSAKLSFRWNATEADNKMLCQLRRKQT